MFSLKDNISEKKKQERMDELMKIQQSISGELNSLKINKTLKTIIDRKEGEYYVGRTEFDSPEVDNEVLIKTNEQKIIIGNVYKVKIESADDFDLYGKIVK